MFPSLGEITCSVGSNTKANPLDPIVGYKKVFSPEDGRRVSSRNVFYSFKKIERRIKSGKQ
jgi:hypothetical protein